jgi:hypothetical protein
MRQRFVEVLQSDDRDDAQSEVLRRFWARAKPLPVRVNAALGTSAKVVDLAQWAERRRASTSHTSTVRG